MLIRFDDVSLNTDMSELNAMAAYCIDKGWSVMYAVSPCIIEPGERDNKQRCFPKILNAFSDWRIFYKLDKIGIPEKIPYHVNVASHGLIHVDHRLLDYAAQELSILASVGLLKTQIFVPPFNKWNMNTEDICRENDINLIKFEAGWLCMDYERRIGGQELWYCHSRRFTLESFINWFDEKD